MSGKRLRFTKEEDDSLWNYVNVTNTSDGVFGTRLWRNLVATGLLPGRTAESLKVGVRFLRFPALSRAAEPLQEHAASEGGASAAGQD